MFFKDSRVKEENTPFFENIQKNSHSFFNQQNSQQSQSAFDLFNQSNNSKKSIIDSLQPFNRQKALAQMSFQSKAEMHSLNGNKMSSIFQNGNNFSFTDNFQNQKPEHFLNQQSSILEQTSQILSNIHNKKYPIKQLEQELINNKPKIHENKDNNESKGFKLKFNKGSKVMDSLRQSRVQQVSENKLQNQVNKVIINQSNGQVIERKNDEQKSSEKQITLSNDDELQKSFKNESNFNLEETSVKDKQLQKINLEMTTGLKQQIMKRQGESNMHNKPMKKMSFQFKNRNQSNINEKNSTVLKQIDDQKQQRKYSQVTPKVSKISENDDNLETMKKNINQSFIYRKYVSQIEQIGQNYQKCKIKVLNTNQTYKFINSRTQKLCERIKQKLRKNSIKK